MNNKFKLTKKMFVYIAVIALIITFGIIFFITKSIQSPYNTGISKNDSKEVKIEKLQQRLNVLDTEIGEMQNQIDMKTEDLNNFYQEYYNISNNYKSDEPTDIEPIN